MPQLFANNVTSVLANAIDANASSLQLASGQGSKFPLPGAGTYFVLTLYQMANNIEINHEIVKCTARNGDLLTIIRAQEGTIARAFASADPVSMRLTAGALTPAALGAMDATAPTGNTLLLANATIATPIAMIDFLTLFTANCDWYSINFMAIKTQFFEQINLRFANGGVVDVADNYQLATNAFGPVTTVPLSTGMDTNQNGAAIIHLYNTNDSVNPKVMTVEFFEQKNQLFKSISYRYVYIKPAALSGFRLYLGGGGNFIGGKIQVVGHKNT